MKDRISMFENVDRQNAVRIKDDNEINLFFVKLFFEIKSFF